LEVKVANLGMEAGYPDKLYLQIVHVNFGAVIYNRPLTVAERFKT
jgi:hypothetical protein